MKALTAELKSVRRLWLEVNMTETHLRILEFAQVKHN